MEGAGGAADDANGRLCTRRTERQAHGSMYTVLGLGGDRRVGWDDSEGSLAPHMADDVHCSSGGLHVPLRPVGAVRHVQSRRARALDINPRDRHTGPRAGGGGIWARRRRANPRRPRHRARSPRGGACRGLAAGGGDRPTAETTTACAVACVHRGRAGPSTNRRHRIGRRPAAAPDEGRARLRPARRRASTTELVACAVTPTSASVLQRLPHRPRCSRQRRPSGRDGHHSGGWRGGYRGGAGVYLASPAPALCPERAPGDNLLGRTCLQRQRHTKGG